MAECDKIGYNTFQELFWLYGGLFAILIVKGTEL